MARPVAAEDSEAGDCRHELNKDGLWLKRRRWWHSRAEPWGGNVLHPLELQK